MYPAVPMFEECAQFMDFPLCTNYDMYAGCDITAFKVIIDTASTICDKTCSRACLTLLQAMSSTGCLDGQLGAYIKAMWPLYEPDTARAFNASLVCSSIMTTKKPSEPPGCQPNISRAACLFSRQHGLVVIALAAIVHLLFTN